jgi:hypothetical protein
LKAAEMMPMEFSSPADALGPRSPRSKRLPSSFLVPSAMTTQDGQIEAIAVEGDELRRQLMQTLGFF